MNFFRRTAILFFFTIIYAGFSAAQTFPVPRQEKLLNGLKILIWRDSQAPKVTVKLRIHNGAAFDPQGKTGTMALLADILFPNIEETKTFFAEDLEGSLNVTSNYDYIQITATGKPDEIETILDSIATAVTNPPITPENFTAVRAARLEKVKELEKNPAYIADRAVAQQLFGDFPYGRSADGTTESLTKIDRFDLVGADDRFFTADNATLAVTGDVNADEVYRLARRLFGAWKKSEGKIPATFRLPDAPDLKQMRIEMPNLDKSYTRTAVIAAARNNKDYYPTLLMTNLLQPKLCYKPGYNAYLLRGIFTVASDKTILNNNELPVNECSRSFMIFVKDGKPVLPSITQNDLDNARSNRLAEINKDLTDLWLDVDTFKLVSVKDELQKINAVTLADIQRVAESSFSSPTVSVIVTKPSEKQN